MQSAANRAEEEGRIFARRLAFVAAALAHIVAALLLLNAARGIGPIGMAASVVMVALAALCLCFASLALRDAQPPAGHAGGRFDLHHFLERAEEGAVVVAMSGRIEAANAHFAALLGVDPAALPGKDMTEVAPGPITEAITTAFDLGLDSTGIIECENQAGEWLTVEVRREPAQIGSEPAFAFILRDLTEMRRREIELATLAFQDSLTHLANRAALQRRLARLGDDLGEGPEASFAIMALDLDRFKQVNDSLGHGAGDELLRETARRIVEAAPRNAFIGRNGGDEFVIVAGPRASYASARQIASHIIEAVARPVPLRGDYVEIGVSIGVALAPADGEDPVALLEAADRAMYEAKRARSGFAFAGDEAERGRLKSVA